MVVLGNSGINKKIAALCIGANGYLTKPFDQYQFTANLDTVMRRTHGQGSATISIGSLFADLSLDYAKVGETRLELTEKGFESLSFWLRERLLF